MSIPADGSLRSSPSTTGPRVTQPNTGGPRYPAPQINLAGIITDLLEFDQALEMIVNAARGSSDEVLGVVSINLDHVHHFAGKLHLEKGRMPSERDTPAAREVRWLN